MQRLNLIHISKRDSEIFLQFLKFNNKIAEIFWQVVADSVKDYRQVSNISRTLVGNKIVDHSNVVGATPIGAAPTTSSLST